MTVLSVLDAAGRRCSPATLPGSDDRHGWRVRVMIIVLWRAGLRVQEALALAEHDLDPRRGSLLVRNGKGGHRRAVGIDEWGWESTPPVAGHARRAAGRPAVASSTAPPAGGRGRVPRSVRSSAGSP